ncbi:MAG: hypothetical protein L3K07_02975 [Thermoplasmata archaeon]|nr:hypothetical protein [Thermoplasmata archaeon]
MEFRRIPGIPAPVSVVGFSVESPASSGVLAIRIGLLEHAIRQGVNLLDLTRSREPEAAEALVGSLRSPPPNLVVLSRLSREPFAGGSERWSEDRLRSLLGAVAGRLRRPHLELLVLDHSEYQEASRAGATSTLDKLVREGALGGLAVRLSYGDPDPRELETLLAGNVRTFLCPWGLLERGAEHGLLPRFGSASACLLAVDPHADGALDGRRALASPLDRAPGERPVDLAELRRQLGPVLALGFLTAERRRTLVEAAVRFALEPPEVSAVLCPLVDPKLTEAICGYERSEPFTPSERERLGLRPAPAPA